MSSSSGELRFITLGGTGTIGKNLMVLEQYGELLIIDAGVMFPDENSPGVDLILPDVSYVLDRRDAVAGLIATHGHEDHIGAIPYLLEQMPVALYGTKLTLGLLESKLAEFEPVEGTTATVVEAGQKRRIGSFAVEFVQVSHSIPDGVALGIETAQGLVVHTSDFKFDQTPLDGKRSDYHKFAEFGTRGTLVMITDCINVERPGQTPSERELGPVFADLFREAPGRIIVTTFASNISRIQRVLDVSAQSGRKVAIEGRSMVRIIETATELGYLRIPPDTIVTLSEAAELEPRQVTIITTGSQGEPLSALSRIGEGAHKDIKAVQGDLVIVSASPIPGNETLIARTINNLVAQGARVVYGPNERVHVSGHGNQEDLRLMLSLVRPEYVIPTHGERRHLVRYRDLAEEMGVPPDHVFILDPGDVVTFDGERARLSEPVHAGTVNVDGLGVGDVGEVVIRDRRDLAQDGILLPVVAVSAETLRPVAPPEVYSRGFVYMGEPSELMEALIPEIEGAIEAAHAQPELDLEVLKAYIKRFVRKYLYQETRRRPIVLPIVVAVGAEGTALTPPSPPGRGSG